MASATSTAQVSPWYAAYPAPRHTPATITREDVLIMIKQKTTSTSRDYILVDLRRSDFEGGTIRDSINLPAQSLYSAIPSLYMLFETARLRKVIWYCSSSKGRGTRAAGWFADYITDQGNDQMQSLVLAEGIRGWATAGDEFTQEMSGYDAEVWSRLLAT